MSQSNSEPVTVYTILGKLQEWIENRVPIPPSKWAEAAQKLVVLLGTEHDRLCQLEQAVAVLKLSYLDADPDRNVSAAKTKIEAQDVYRLLREQSLLCKRIEEFIRISKLQSRLQAAELGAH